MDKGVAVVLLLFLILISLFPSADPMFSSALGTPGNDEVSNSANARNKALYGSWIVPGDLYNDGLYMSPLTHLIYYPFFALFGAGFVQARMSAILFSFFTALFFYLAVRKQSGKTAFVSLLLLCSTFVFIMYSRLALFEAYLLFFMVLSFYFYQKSADNHVWLFFMMLAASATYFIKFSGVFIIPVCLAASMPFIYDTLKNKNYKKAMKLASYLFLGIVIPLIIYIVFVIMPDQAGWQLANFKYAERSTDFNSPMLLLFKLAVYGFHNTFFERMPVASFFAFAYVLVFFFEALKNKRVDRLDLFMVLWLFFGIGWNLLIDLKYARYVLLIPAICVLAAKALVKLPKLDFSVVFSYFRQNKLLFLASLFLISYFIYSSSMLLFFAASPGFSIGDGIFYRSQLVDYSFSASSPFAVILLAAGVSIFFSIILSFIMLKSETKLKLPKNIASALIILSIIIGLTQYAFWANSRTYYYYDSSKELGKMLEPTIIQGGTFLVMETNHQDLYLMDRNTEQMTNRTDVRFFVAQTSPEPEAEAASTRLKNYYQNASLVKTFRIEDFELGLFDKYPWLPINDSSYTLPGTPAKD